MARNLCSNIGSLYFSLLSLGGSLAGWLAGWLTGWLDGWWSWVGLNVAWNSQHHEFHICYRAVFVSRSLLAWCPFQSVPFLHCLKHSEHKLQSEAACSCSPCSCIKRSLLAVSYLTSQCVSVFVFTLYITFSFGCLFPHVSFFNFFFFYPTRHNYKAIDRETTESTYIWLYYHPFPYFAFFCPFLPLSLLQAFFFLHRCNTTWGHQFLTHVI